MSRLLIHEPPLQVLPSLASHIGLNEAIVLQQVHYWLNPHHNKNVVEGKHWVYNSYSDWKKQFPFWSVETIKRTIYSLEKHGLLLSQKQQDNKFDHRKSYTIDYKVLERLTEGNSSSTPPNDRSGHYDTIDKKESDPADQVNMTQSNRSNCADLYKEQRVQTETTTETHTLARVPGEKLDLEEGRSPVEKSIRLVKPETESVLCAQSLPVENQMIDLWNQIVQPDSPVQGSDERGQKLRSLLQQTWKGQLAGWQQICEEVRGSSFLMGRGERGWRATLDWVLMPQNLRKVQEGNYKDSDASTSLNLSAEGASEQLMWAQQHIDSLVDPWWQRLNVEILARVGPIAYRSWFQEVVLRSCTATTCTLTAPTRFIADSVINRFKVEILDSLQVLMPTLQDVECVSTPLFQEPLRATAAADETKERDRDLCVAKEKEGSEIPLPKPLSQTFLNDFEALNHGCEGQSKRLPFLEIAQSHLRLISREYLR